MTAALALKEGAISGGTTGQYWRGDKSWQTLDKAAVGLNNVDNTSDSNKPVSTAQATAIALKEALIVAGTTAQYWRGDKTWQTLDKAAVGLGNVDNTSDANKPVSTAQASAIAAKESTVVAGTTAQYYRGDKSWQSFATDVLNSVLASFTSFATRTAITATDSVFTAFRKVQKYLDDLGDAAFKNTGNR